MSPIKFRAWDTETKSYVKSGFDFRIDGQGYVYKRKWGESIWQRTDNLIIEQLTNLKDKNGKDDWIDDIVETKIGGFTYRRRIFQAESGAFCINLPVIGATGGEDAIMLITCEHENIGNVHSNPELLEGKKCPT